MVGQFFSCCIALPLLTASSASTAFDAVAVDTLIYSQYNQDENQALSVQEKGINSRSSAILTGVAESDTSTAASSHCGRGDTGLGQEYWYPHQVAMDGTATYTCAKDADYPEEYYTDDSFCEAFLFLTKDECCVPYPEACVATDNQGGASAEAEDGEGTTLPRRELERKTTIDPEADEAVGTDAGTPSPTSSPTSLPVTVKPSEQPTAKPVTESPAKQPSSNPVTGSPTKQPTPSPVTAESEQPTAKPVKESPTNHPASNPVTPSPTKSPVIVQSPTSSPVTGSPTDQPISIPVTANPTDQPTPKPVTADPTKQPTARPLTESPTEQPTSKSVTGSPIEQPIAKPLTESPTEQPTSKPVPDPTEQPTAKPLTESPTEQLTTNPVTPSPAKSPAIVQSPTSSPVAASDENNEGSHSHDNGKGNNDNNNGGDGNNGKNGNSSNHNAGDGNNGKLIGTTALDPEANEAAGTSAGAGDKNNGGNHSHDNGKGNNNNNNGGDDNNGKNGNSSNHNGGDGNNGYLRNESNEVSAPKGMDASKSNKNPTLIFFFLLIGGAMIGYIFGYFTRVWQVKRMELEINSSFLPSSNSVCRPKRSFARKVLHDIDELSVDLKVMEEDGLSSIIFIEDSEVSSTNSIMTKEDCVDLAKRLEKMERQLLDLAGETHREDAMRALAEATHQQSERADKLQKKVRSQKKKIGTLNDLYASPDGVPPSRAFPPYEPCLVPNNLTTDSTKPGQNPLNPLNLNEEGVIAVESGEIA